MIVLEEEELLGIIAQMPRETDHWDFKREWYKQDDKGSMLADIINFVNTVHHDDCYIIIGVDEDARKIVGVEDNEYTLNRQQLQDYLRKIPFAQNWYPETDVERFNVEGHKVDVITIFNSDNTPIFLTREVKRKGTPLKPGIIYARISDSNAPSDRSVSDEQMERLWKKRFRLDVSVYDRYKYLLNHPNEWTNIISNDGRETFIYTKDPNFVIKSGELREDKNLHYESFAMSEFNIRINRFQIELYYGQTVIHDDFYVPLDDGSYEIVVPMVGYIYLGGEHEPRSYTYYLKGDFPYLLTQLINSFNDKPHWRVNWENVKEDVVIFQDESEREYYEELFKEMYVDENRDKLSPSKSELEVVKRKIKASGWRKIDGDLDKLASRLMKEHKVVQAIKKLQEEKTYDSRR